MIAGTIIGGWTQPTYRDDLGGYSPEHVTEQVPLAEIQEGDMLQDPKSGQLDQSRANSRLNERHSQVLGRVEDGNRAVSRLLRRRWEGRRSIPGFVKGLVTRQVRE